MSLKHEIAEGERYTYDYFFLDNVCRLCWSADGIIELSSCSPKSMDKLTTIAEIIQECIGIDVTTHNHLRKLCSKCLNEIEIFTEFKRFCQESERKLHDILEIGSSYKKTISPEENNSTKMDEHLVKEESDVDFNNMDSNIDESLDEFLNDLPLPCVIKNMDLLVRKKRKERKHYCSFCRLYLESNKNLVEHKLEWHGIEEDGLCKCYGCEKKFDNVKKRLRHETDFCKELKNGYKCSICDRHLPKRRSYEHHMRAHKENKEVDLPDDIYKCDKCLKSYESMEVLKTHMLTHLKKKKEEEKKTYVCDTCGRIFTRRDYLYKHKLVHEGGKPQKCPHCDYRTVQRSSLTVHIRRHTGERPYPCDMCPHRCLTSSNLRVHRKQHLGIKSFECKLCDKKFGYKISLEEHMSAIHAQPETYACKQCGATYSRFRGLRRHLLAKHGKKVKKVKDDLVEVNYTQDKVISELETQTGQCDVFNSQTEHQNGQCDALSEIQVQASQVEVPKCEEV